MGEYPKMTYPLGWKISVQALEGKRICRLTHEYRLNMLLSVDMLERIQKRISEAYISKINYK